MPFMRYVMARHTQERRDRAYRFYITDSLKVIGGLNIRYADMIDDTPVKEVDPDEIIKRLSEGLDALGRDDQDGNGIV